MQGAFRTMARRSADTWMVAILVMLSLGVTIELAGWYFAAALDLVVIATLAAAVVVGGRLPRRPPSRRAVQGAALACAAMTARGATPFNESNLAVAIVAVLLLVLLGAAFRWRGSNLPGWIGPAAVALIGLQAALVWQWGHGVIDVYGVMDTSAQRLLHGVNPYSLTVVGFQQPHHGADLVPVGTHLPYLPGAVLADVPGSLLGDVRLTSLLAWLGMMIGLACIARRHRGGGSDRAVLAMVWPFAPVLIIAAYVDLLAVAALVGWLAARHRCRWGAVLLLGGGLAVKPLLPLVLLVYFLRGGRALRVEIAVAGLIAALICLPFAIATGVGQFVTDTTLGLAGDVPAFDNALSVNSLAVAQFGTSIPSWLVVALLMGALALTYRRPVQDMADLAYASAFFILVFAALSPYSFSNYYQYPLVLMLLGICSRRTPDRASNQAERRIGGSRPAAA